MASARGLWPVAKPMSAKAISIIIVVAGTLLYRASGWWERAYATYESSEMSPDGCFRIDTYKPFWILPSLLHRSPDPDPTIIRGLGRPWEAAIFKRAYEIQTGAFLGETVAFDPVGPANLIYWGDTGTPGRRVVFANEFPLFDSAHCSDKKTLAKLEAFYEREREANEKRLLALTREREDTDAASLRNQ